jgi:hypothetical protein
LITSLHYRGIKLKGGVRHAICEDDLAAAAAGAKALITSVHYRGIKLKGGVRHAICEDDLAAAAAVMMLIHCKGVKLTQLAVERCSITSMHSQCVKLARVISCELQSHQLLCPDRCHHRCGRCTYFPSCTQGT